jgi:aspartate carbamoyltransferase catalytic subunit
MVRHLITIDDLSEAEILAIFNQADDYLATMTHPDRPWRIRGGRSDASQFQLATLFYEASTRTRFSFESAMGRLGGQVLSSADPKTTSAAKGETLADTIRVVENYADVVVIRHPNEGAARVLADFAEIPIINAGDGGHEHPTQTLCDLYTLRREKGSLKNLNVALWGDLKHGRTAHSLAYGLARFGAKILSMAAPGFELPEHVLQRLEQDYGCVPVSSSEIDRLRRDDLAVDAAYIAPAKPHQRTLFTNPLATSTGETTAHDLATQAARPARIDALYVTRLQRERMTAGDGTGSYDTINAEFLRDRLDPSSSVMHPLPRVEELSQEIDSDARAVYFKQAAYGVPVRMALLAAVLGVKPGILAPEEPVSKYPLYSGHNVHCENTRCICGHEAERRYLQPRFRMLFKHQQVVLRCTYCDHELTPAWIGHLSTQTCTPNSHLPQPPAADSLVFPDEAAARAAGFAPQT